MEKANWRQINGITKEILKNKKSMALEKLSIKMVTNLKGDLLVTVLKKDGENWIYPKIQFIKVKFWSISLMEKDLCNVQSLNTMDNMWKVWKKGKEKFNIQMGIGLKVHGNPTIKFLGMEKPLMVSIKEGY